MNGKNHDSLTRTLALPLQGAAAEDGPRLVTIRGTGQGVVYPLASGPNTIGRRPANTIVIPSQGVSKIHCTIDVAPERVTIVDNESTNGTLVNGRPLGPKAPHTLVHGDMIAIADTRLLFLQGRRQQGGETPQVRVDFQSAAHEAETLLKGNADLIALRQARRRKP